MSIRLTGRVDMLVWQERPRRGWVHFQTKTLGGRSQLPIYVAGIAVSDHERIYRWLVEQDYHPYVGSVLNILQKTVTGPKKAGQPRAVSPSWSPFYRHQITVGERGVERALEAARFTARLIRECERADRWPQFTESCTVYNRKCTFYDACRTGRIIKDEYIERERDYVDEAAGVYDDEVFNVSRLLAFRRCPTFYARTYVDDLARSKDELEPKQLTFGTAIHEALRAWYGPPEGHDVSAPWRPVLDDDAALEAAQKIFERYPDHDENADEVHTSGYAELMLKRYFERWRPLDSQIERVAAVEKVFTREVK